MDFKISKFDENIKDYLKNNTKGIIHFCAKNSILHLKGAMKLSSIDPNIAVFKSLTAEEEAVKSLFMVLKQKRYTNAQKLKFNNHLHKFAVIPFLNSISQFISNFAGHNDFPFGENFNLYFDKNDGDKLKVSFPFAGGFLKPTPPLNFSVTKNGAEYYFQKEFSEIGTSVNKNDIIKTLKEIADFRNRMLYAESKGIPAIKGNANEEIEKRKAHVFRIFKIMCLILPYKKSLFVQQAQNSFINLMEKVALNNLAI